MTTHPGLGSPGSQTSGRAKLERQTLTAGQKVLDRFLADTQKMAKRGDTSLGHVLGAWVEAVDRLADKMNLDPRSRERLLASRVPVDVHASVSEVLAQGREQGWGPRRLGSELRSAFDPATGTAFRSVDGELETKGMSWQDQFDRTVRTESTAAFSRSTGEALSASGYAQKRWVAHYDATTRPSHAEASGQTVPLGAEFLVGGFTLAYPGDPNAPLSETMGCRCVLVAVR